MLLFTYGTLKTGGSAHGLMGESKSLGVVRTAPNYCLYTISSFAGMVCEDENQGVLGELFEVPESVLPGLDSYEGVPGLFTRSCIKLEDGREVFSYLFARPIAGKAKIEKGFWP